MNNTVFKDPQCICSLGLRDYFVNTVEEREKTYLGIRDSSDLLRKHYENSGHFSHNDDTTLREANSNIDLVSRIDNLKSADLLEF